MFAFLIVSMVGCEEGMGTWPTESEYPSEIRFAFYLNLIFFNSFLIVNFVTLLKISMLFLHMISIQSNISRFLKGSVGCMRTFTFLKGSANFILKNC